MKLIQCPECEGTGYTYHDDILECSLCNREGVIYVCSLAEKEHTDRAVEKYVDEIRRVKGYIRQWQGLLSGDLMVDKNGKVIERREPQEGDSWFIRYHFKENG